MKVAVINYSGSVRKTLISSYLLARAALLNKSDFG